MLTEFCARIAAQGLPLTRAQAFIDTLHPIYGGRAYTWQIAKGETTATEYAPANDGEMLARWQKSPFYRLISRAARPRCVFCRLTKDGVAEYPLLGELYSRAGITEYVAIVDRFGADAVIGEMDCVYSSWSTDAPNGFAEAEIADLDRLTPWSCTGDRNPPRLPGRQDPGRDLSRPRSRPAGPDGQHRPRRRLPDRGRPLVQRSARLYAHQRSGAARGRHPAAQRLCRGRHLGDPREGGDVLKLIGDGTLAFFTAEDRASACRSALTAAQAARLASPT